MSGRNRISYQPASATSGGGGTPTTGNVEWGPDFGDESGSDNNTDTVNVAADITAVTVTNDDTLNVAVDITTLTLTNDDTANVAVDLESLALTNNDTLNVAADLTNTALTNDDTLNAAVDFASATLTNEDTVNISLAGSALGAPFWQSEAHNAASGASSSITINKPSGTVDGDFLLAFIAAADVTSTPAFTPPSGWTEATTVTGPAGAESKRVTAYYKFASSEPTNYTWTFGDPTLDEVVGEIHRIKGVDTTTPINASNTATLAASALDPDPDAPSVTTTVANCLVMEYLFHDHAALSQSHTLDAGHTETTDFQSTTTIIKGSCSGFRIFAATGATGAAQFNCTETVSTDATMIRIAIAPGTITLPS